MNNPAGLIALILGIVLLVFGFIATNSMNLGFSNFFTESPLNQAIWLIIAGAIITAGELVLMARGNSRSS